MPSISHAMDVSPIACRSSPEQVRCASADLLPGLAERATHVTRFLPPAPADVRLIVTGPEGTGAFLAGLHAAFDAPPASEGGS
jgi:hypothetical protein